MVWVDHEVLATLAAKSTRLGEALTALAATTVTVRVRLVPHVSPWMLRSPVNELFVANCLDQVIPAQAMQLEGHVVRVDVAADRAALLERERGKGASIPRQVTPVQIDCIPSRHGRLTSSTAQNNGEDDFRRPHQLPVRQSLVTTFSRSIPVG
jgi:hypothetical protein